MRSKFHSVLAKIQAVKWVNGHYFQSFTPFVLSVFGNETCILHHFAFLVWLPTQNFSSPITHIQPLKSHFLTVVLPFLTMFLMVLKGFIYTIPVYFYAYLLAFSTKMHCIQHQNAQHLAPKHTAFSSKWPPKACKWRSFEINIHFAAFTSPPFLHQNEPSRESIFWGKWVRWWIKRAAIVLKAVRKSRQKTRRWQAG